MSPVRWHKLMSQWQAPDSDSVLSELMSAYSEPHRHYHTAHHIDDCLARLDESAFLAEAPEEVELALWFHDAIYTPALPANERRSADWATRFLESIGAPERKRIRVRDCIMATRHTAEASSGDAAIVVDIDLSILGREPDTSMSGPFERNTAGSLSRSIEGSV